MFLKNKKDIHTIIVVDKHDYKVYKVDERKLVKNSWFFKIGDEAYAIDKRRKLHVFFRGVTDEIKDFKFDENEKIIKEFDTARLSKILLETKVLNETFSKNTENVLIILALILVFAAVGLNIYFTQELKNSIQHFLTYNTYVPHTPPSFPINNSINSINNTNMSNVISNITNVTNLTG